MQVKVLVLINQQILISQIEEVAPLDIGDPNCKLIEPFILGENDTLSPWLIDVTNDNEVLSKFKDQLKAKEEEANASKSSDTNKPQQISISDR